MVAKNNNLEIFYTMEDEAGLLETQLLNSNQRQWTLDDFIASYVRLGYKEFIKLIDFKKETGFSNQMTMAVLAKATSGHDLEGMRNTLKNGTFHSDNWGYATEVVAKLNDLSPYFATKGIQRNREFLLALNKTIKLVDWDKFLEKLEQAKPRLELQVNIRNYLRQFEDVYNYKNPWKSKVNLDTRRETVNV